MVVCDWEAAGGMAARHFLELGDFHFAFYRFFDDPDITECRNGFTRELEAHGHSVHQIDYGATAEGEMCRFTSRAERVRWCSEQLSALPRPLAVMAGNDNFAVDLVLAARELAWNIPRDIAILGAEDQPLIRGTVSEEISSVDVNLREVGRVGAQLLELLLQGASPDSNDVPLLVKVSPKGLKVRDSTCTFACDHAGVSAAALFIRNHYHEAISVTDVAAHAGMSLRSLHAEYTRRVGRTVKEAIITERLKRAESLLERTELKLAAVAAESGFGNPEHLCHVFQRTHHLTPQAWRQQRRNPD
jgi:LacI family transcriptional regulator